MSDLNAVMERLLTDPEYRQAFAADPVGAMAGYDLTVQERQMLLTDVSPDTVVGSGVEQRTSKAGMFALLGEAAHLFDTAGALDHDAPGPDETRGIVIINSAPAPGLGGTDGAIEWTYTPAETHGIIIHDAPAETHGIIIHDAPAETDGIIVYDMPAPDAEASAPGPDGAVIHGFDPQPDPPGEPADAIRRGEPVGDKLAAAQVGEVNETPAPGIADRGGLLRAGFPTETIKTSQS
jgi:hypothetical protein